MKEIIKILLHKIISSVGNLITFTILVSSIEANIFAKYILVIACFSVANSLIEANEYSYIKVFARCDAQKKKLISYEGYRFFRNIFRLVYLISTIIIYYLFNGQENIVILVAIITYFNILIGDKNTKFIILNKQFEYSKVNNYLSISNMASVLFALFSSKILETYLVLNLMFIIMGFVLIKDANFKNKIKVKANLKNYFQDLKIYIGTSVISAVKKNYLYLFIGVAEQQELLIIFTTFKKYFDYMHKGMSGFIDQMYIRISKYEDSNKGNMFKRILFTLGIRALFTLAIGTSVFLYLKNYLNYDSYELLNVGLILGLNFILSYFITIATFYASKYNPKLILMNSIITSFGLVLLPYMYISKSNELAPVYALINTTVLSIVVFCLPVFFKIKMYKLNIISIICTIFSVGLAACI